MQNNFTLTSSRRLLYIRDLLYELVVRDFKLRYKRSILGVGWSLLNPLAQLLVYQLVFTTIIPNEIDNFVAFLFIGILSWDWFQASLMAATNSIVGNRDLIKRPGFPSPVLPLIAVTSNLVNFIISLPILAAVLIFQGTPFTSVLLLFPLVIVLQFCFTLGLSYFLATFHVTFRDTEYLLGILLKLVFFMTGIFYDPAPLIARFSILNLNPMVYILGAYRSIVVSGEAPALQPILILSGASIVLLGLGYATFKQASYRYVEEL